MKDQTKDVPIWIYLFLPLTILFSQYIVKALSENSYQKYFVGEMGFVELVTVLFLILAFVFGLLSFRTSLSLKFKFLPVWLALFSLGSFYFGGEEASWGQHLFGWASPEFFANINDQGETNLHNISGLFDQLPRTILTIGALLGGLILPVLVKVFKLDLSKFNLDLYVPRLNSSLAAFLAVFISFFDKLLDKSSLPGFLNIVDGENKECFLALFLMIYIYSIFLRIRKV